MREVGMVIRQSVEFYHVRLLPQITLCFHGFRKVLNRCFLVFAPAANGSFDVPRRSMGPNAVGQLRAGRAYASARHSDFANVANCASLCLHSMAPHEVLVLERVSKQDHRLCAQRLRRASENRSRPSAVFC